MHTDPELLGLLALGERAGDLDDLTHAETCAQCSAQLSELRRVVSLARSVGTETTLDLPSPDVWTRILGEIHFEPARRPAEQRPLSASERLASPSFAPSVEATVSPAEEHARAPLRAGIRGAVAKLFARSPKPTAHAELTPVEPSWSAASGVAEIATDEQGRRVLTVALQADLPTSGVRQAWLVHRDDPNVRQSLGILDGPHGLWTVEHSIDLQEYGILDISQQRTGETQHSGHTIVRGELTLVS